MDVLLTVAGILILGGVFALILSRSPRAATVLGAGTAAAGSVVGLVPAFRVLLGGMSETRALPWDALHGEFRVELDALSAFFLVPVLGLAALGAVYGGEYLFAYHRRKSLGAPWFFYNLFVAGMVMVVVARTAILFLMAWEVMSLAAFFLVTFEHEQAEVRRAGWVYLIATHLGAAFLFATFLLISRRAGALDFAAFSAVQESDAGWAGLTFVLALVGFGAKAGLVPFHVWLPEAHPAAPSHVSALMSGVMIKMGLYGLLRVLSFLGPPAPWWGPTLAAFGLVTGVVGIALALHQRDLKRALAYSSIENMGLIVLSLGVGLWGWARAMPSVAALGVTGALLHVWNHALMKGLMFFAAGSVLHGAGTKDIERLGGLMKRMPWTGSAMLLGAVAICGLPPLNGFVSEWFMYVGLLKSGLATTDSRGLVALLAVGLLALIGDLAALTYVRLCGIALLGSPRSEEASHAHESSWRMLGPIVVLLVSCVGVAVFPNLVVDALARPLDQVLGLEPGQTVLELALSGAPLYELGAFNAWALVAFALTAAVLSALYRRGAQAEESTWGCGYARPTVRMQYTGRSFSELMAEHFLPRSLRPRTTRCLPRSLFPAVGSFASECPDPVSETFYEPLWARWARRFVRLRVLQQGKVHVYLIYITLTVVTALTWVSLRTWWGGL
jgi:formate hydrogenlyase subunit 3/multisubunit Na+/H+ antiporter MnhD subunit